MEAAQYCMKKNPHDSTNPIMKLFFLWTIKLFKVGSKKDLQIEDLFGPKTKDKSTSIGLELARHWNTEVNRCQKKISEDKDRDPKKQPKPSLFRALFFTFKWEFVFLGILGFFNEVISRLSQPILLGILLSYFRPVPLIPIEHALYAAGALVLINLITAISVNHYMFASYRLGMRARIAVCSLIYRKSLKLSATALGDSTPGKVVNLLSNDVNRFDLSAFFMHFLWLAPLAALVTLVLLWQEVGIAGVLGVAVVFTVMPLQSYTGKLSARFRLQTAIRTDERVRLMNEIISGVQVIKMYTWEIPFSKLVQLARKLELRVVRKNTYVRALFMSFMLFTTRAAIFCTMTSLVLQGIPLTATKVFVFAQFFATLSISMSAMFVRSISESAEAWVSIHRLQDFLNQDEFQGHHQTQKINCSIISGDEKQVAEIVKNVSMDCKKSRTSVKITKGNAKWGASEVASTLQDIDIEILKGKLVGIIGPVGSGKSSLLQTILGELNLESGSIEINGKISYASQEPWVFGSTVRQNILFGLPYDDFSQFKSLAWYMHIKPSVVLFVTTAGSSSRPTLDQRGGHEPLKLK
ncbi:hypothetical protein EVAR_56612_1 [Eumeta japonica]|uniref:ABC transmembrane type-1 domain-containing protein n=1 Tax=Eumeta variegata TaxID=151549 RepID=A0A4C1XH08_EUMVA|nr:hypothetical protein EVAR_56612_1 [Eumeta japonica]